MNKQNRITDRTYHQTSPKRVQSVVLGNFKVMYRPGITFEQARIRLLKQGLTVHETSHFIFAQALEKPFVHLVHQISLDTIDNNIGYYLMQELAPYGLMNSDHDFGAALIGTVISTLPNDPVGAWSKFSSNTFQQLQEQLASQPTQQRSDDFITSFAEIYRRLFELKTGSSLLDAGCACAFWPLLVAKQERNKQDKIIGVDNRQDALNLSHNLAKTLSVDHVEFILANILSAAFTDLGTFDTVTAIHLLEHIPETQLPLAFDNLLKVTHQRLLVVVPYEPQPEIAYGHQQVFSHEKLEFWGQWCVTHLDGKGCSWCEQLEGGLLVIDRLP